jgi:quinol-cytochrome oxidoreductase complex cytochrome b subunit
MPKFAHYVQESEDPDVRRKQIHPIWRGIGWILMIVVPVLSYLGAIEVLKANSTKNWFPIPTDILSPWGSDPLIFVKLLIALAITIVAFTIIFLIGAIINSLVGPSRYGPKDAPPMTREELQRSIVRGRSR